MGEVLKMKLSKNNIQSKLQKEAHQIPNFSIRKLTIRAAGECDHQRWSA